MASNATAVAPSQSFDDHYYWITETIESSSTMTDIVAPDGKSLRHVWEKQILCAKTLDAQKELGKLFETCSKNRCGDWSKVPLAAFHDIRKFVDDNSRKVEQPPVIVDSNSDEEDQEGDPFWSKVKISTLSSDAQIKHQAWSMVAPHLRSFVLGEILPREEAYGQKAVALYKESKGLICAEMVPYIFPKGTNVSIRGENDTVYGGQVSTSPKYAFDWSGTCVTMSVEYFAVNVTGVGKKTYSEFTTNTTQLARDIVDCEPLTPEAHDLLQARGQRFVELMRQPMLMLNSGFIHSPANYVTSAFACHDGRVMVDMLGFHKNVEMDINHIYGHRWNIDGTARLDLLPDSELWKLPACVPIYAMNLDKWGVACVDDLKPVVFDRERLGKLALDDVVKDYVLCLAKDTIEGHAPLATLDSKGSGLCVLFHGPPGTGKTAACEAYAEHFGVPLYYVNAGLLGTTVADINKNLNDIFALVKRWKGIALMDEADLFLRSRTKTDNIQRNAMVCAFLKALEYYNGVFFLTTNLDMSDLDPAVDSRLHCKIKFSPVDTTVLWKLIPKHCNIKLSDKDAETLSNKYPGIQGRVIRNVCSNVLRASRGRDPKLDDFIAALSAAGHFTR